MGSFGSFNGQIRKYYNFEKRARQNRNTKNNSGDFIALNVFYMLDPLNEPNDPIFGVQPFYGIGAVWGLNRTYQNGFSILFYIGLGYVEYNFDFFEFNFSGIGEHAGIRLGFALNAEK
jgi:hypothetical protein